MDLVADPDRYPVAHHVDRYAARVLERRDQQHRASGVREVAAVDQRNVSVLRRRLYVRGVSKVSAPTLRRPSAPVSLLPGYFSGDPTAWKRVVPPEPSGRS